MKKVLSLFSTLLGIILGCTGGPFVNPPVISEARADQGSLVAPAASLPTEIVERLGRVPEFAFIRAEARRLGIRAYLFGGTAAGYAHYVKWDLLRENGDLRFQRDRFDYDYTNIFRSTQDMDIVVDGPPEAAAALQKTLADKYPHLQGGKELWEVRLLRQQAGDKQALLNNPDFLNQHTDSNSTGLIEITSPPPGESGIRDLRDWNSAEPAFLKDIREGKLHYYFSESHGSTSFARAGRNPPILSVIRYLTKAFQYELEIRPEDLIHLKRVIDGFDPRGQEMSNGYVRNWLLKKDNGRKLIQNAVNAEYAWNTLEKLGLRKKLMQIEGNPAEYNSLAWWLNKEPLRTSPLGLGTGRTAAELVKEGRLRPDLVIAHETRDYLAHESITRAHTGEPNVLISRQGVNGETAVHGPGFYTRVGRSGAVGSHITVRLNLDPVAREGTDFMIAGDFVVVKNKAAVRVISESLNWNYLQYIQFLAHGENIPSNERAVFAKLKRRLTHQALTLSTEDYHLMQREILDVMASGRIPWAAAMELLSLPRGREYEAALFQEISRLIPRMEMADFDELLRNFKPDTISEEMVGKIMDRVKSLSGGEISSRLTGLLVRSRPKGWVQDLSELFGRMDRLSILGVLDRLQNEAGMAGATPLLIAALERNRQTGLQGLGSKILIPESVAHAIQKQYAPSPEWDAVVRELIRNARTGPEIMDIARNIPPSASNAQALRAQIAALPPTEARFLKLQASGIIDGYMARAEPGRRRSSGSCMGFFKRSFGR